MKWVDNKVLELGLNSFNSLEENRFYEFVSLCFSKYEKLLYLPECYLSKNYISVLFLVK